MHSVLFICTANQCRSPLAEGLLRLRVGAGDPEWRIRSAGTWAEDGAPITYYSQLILEQHGIDLSAHSACTINQNLVDTHRLILTMTRNHKEALRLEFPAAAGRIFLLSEMIGRVYDIADPVGKSFDDYEETAREIDLILDRGFEKIRQLSEEGASQPQ